ncbi:MAG: toll/interleukin-1 receptor domain-containing protein [Chloroflexi bacterium]|uniref:Toll/interleukin-1 receptor domain-containing protein n=1 Tax=Candidatus Chlorohelix allophototropha TaxID=3003348 RepID=A0A8T7M964_9CHLR|nr:toll/interleukin-1 receptor domain-containing protein [Chloroflexota bacterium]WJW68589.1 toll/interleukin-1 receptor domain-containing protein [Chloroflexota bacterium L227-S17]
MTTTQNHNLLRVFLCHSSSDKLAVRKLYNRLKAEGFDPWLDEVNLIAGQIWQDEIEKAVEQSHVVLVCLTPASITKEGYVQREIRVALDAADYKPEGTLFIIPAKLQECEVPRRLSRWHWVNLFEANGYAKLIEALRTREASIPPNVTQVHTPPVITQRASNSPARVNSSYTVWAAIIAVVAILILVVALLFTSNKASGNTPVAGITNSINLVTDQNTATPTTIAPTTLAPTTATTTKLQTTAATSVVVTSQTTATTIKTTPPTTPPTIPTTTAAPVTTVKTPVSFTVVPTATGFNDVGIERVWNRIDKPVSEIPGIGRSFTWGASPISKVSTEMYNNSPRVVQYFDKGRMEVNYPGNNTTGAFYVTNGLLVMELVSGRRMDGDNTYTELEASAIPVVGDAQNNISPTYATFKSVATLWDNNNNKPSAIGAVINTRIDKAGNVTTFNPPEERKMASYDSSSGHNIADVFVNYMNKTGLIQNENGTIETRKIFADATYLNTPDIFFGRPITEAYWTRAPVAGVERDILVQLFERRILTYTPSVPADYQIEMTNLGQHYYQWRYVDNKG